MSCLINDSKLLYPRLYRQSVCFTLTPIATLNIGLPKHDIYNHLALLTKLFINTLTIWATSILVPFLFDYVLGWRAWIEEEERIFVLLDVDSQDHLVPLEAEEG